MTGGDARLIFFRIFGILYSSGDYLGEIIHSWSKLLD